MLIEEVIKRSVRPPLARAVLRPGSSAWPNPRPKVTDPSVMVDLAGVAAKEFIEFQVELLHGANINDPQRWRGKEQAGLYASSFGYGFSGSLGVFGRSF